MPWTPADARRKNGLAVSTAERAAFEARMALLARVDNLFEADAIFEGGGVLGTAFLGAARCCDDLGLRWHGIAGTSAGAISAALLAAHLPIDQLEYELGRVDFRDFLRQKSNRFVFNGEPGDDLDHPITLIANLALIGELGEYSTDPFQQWLDDVLRHAGIPTFADVWNANPRAPKDRQLKVVVSDLTRGEMIVLPDDLEPPGEKPYRIALTARQRSFRVSEAVRLSMCIPFFFEPGTLDRPAGTSTVVDGGILSNFPLWIYDEDVPGKAPEWPTFGFRLIDKSADAERPIDGVGALFAAMMRTMMLASDRRYLSQRHLGRVIDLDLTGLHLTATSFNLTNDAKDALYTRGYLCAKKFFLTEWDWRKHVKQRTGLTV